jgi:transposase InsO family protein
MMIPNLLFFSHFLRLSINQFIRRWSKPATGLLAAGLLTDLTRSRTDLLVENAMLRQQLIILNRQVNRPHLKNSERIRLVSLARFTNFWQQALHIIQPDTLLRWHREFFRIYWRRKSKNNQHKPHIAPETIALIKQIAQENRLWGAERIRGELLKLGIRVSKRTIQRYMSKKQKKSSQTWATFLRNHAFEIWACDFTVVHDLFFRPTYIFIIIELHTRRILHTAVTLSPTDAWTAQQLREATPWGQGPKYLLHDRDRKYGHKFATVAAGSGIKELRSPIRAPKANAVCERIIGSLKRECLDHMLIWHRAQVYRLVKTYTAYYNLARPHQGIHQRIPEHYALPPRSSTNCSPPRIISEPVLGGLHHHYRCTPRLN